jgi:hypothetical protein
VFKAMLSDCLSSGFGEESSTKQTPLFGDDLIFTVDGFMSEVETGNLIEFAEKRGFDNQFHEADGYVTYRWNDRIAIDDVEFAELLWQRLQRHMPMVGGKQPTGCSSNIRLYKYTEGMRFGKHVDGSNDDAKGRSSEYTVLCYLNDASDGLLGGGETAFYTGEYDDSDVEESVVVAFAPKQGTVLLHGHGERCLLHEGREVTKGTKYLLRTDVMYTDTRRQKKKKKARTRA